MWRNRRSWGNFFAKVCRSSRSTNILVVLMLIRVGLYVNICVQTKKWMDVKDSGEPHAVARRDLLSFYDLVPAYDDFNQVTKDDFRVPENRVKNESKRKKRDLAGLNRSTEHTVRGVETFEEGESGDGSRSAPDDNSNRSQSERACYPIVVKQNASNSNVV